MSAPDWPAAVAVQHAAAAAITAEPLDGSDRVVEIASAAQSTLDDAWRASSAWPADGEWSKAYAIVRNAVLAWGRRKRAQERDEQIEATRSGAHAALDRVSRW